MHKKINTGLKVFSLQPKMCDSVLPCHCLPLDTGVRTMVSSKVSIYQDGWDFNLSLQSQRKNETLFSISDLLFKTQLGLPSYPPSFSLSGGMPVSYLPARPVSRYSSPGRSTLTFPHGSRGNNNLKIVSHQNTFLVGKLLK